MKRLLIADDDAGMRAALEARFTRRGWQVDVAVNGSEALTKFRQGPRPLPYDPLRTMKESMPESTTGFKNPLAG